MTRPPSTRLERRRRAQASKGPPRDLQTLAAAVPAAAASIGGAEADRAARAVAAEIGAANAAGRGFAEVARDLAGGVSAFRTGTIAHEAAEVPAGLDCRAGCAFCCILAGEDGALISQAEAQAVHAALQPVAGLPDGRAFHAAACPALDPETLTCRVYDARPIICRAYISTDAEACRAAVEGEIRPGPGVLSAYPLYLAILDLARALFGVPNVPTYSLARLAAAAVEGKPLEAALAQAKHRPTVLRGERRRIDGGR